MQGKIRVGAMSWGLCHGRITADSSSLWTSRGCKNRCCGQSGCCLVS